MGWESKREGCQWDGRGRERCCWDVRGREREKDVAGMAEGERKRGREGGRERNGMNELEKMIKMKG